MRSENFVCAHFKKAKSNPILCSSIFVRAKNQDFEAYCLAVTVPLIIKTSGEFTAFEFTVIDLVNAPMLLVL